MNKVALPNYKRLFSKIHCSMLLSLLLLLTTTFLQGGVIKNSESEFMNNAIYKRGDSSPYTGMIQEAYPNGSSKTELQVANGRVAAIRQFTESGKRSLDAKLDGNRLAAGYFEYLPDGSLKYDVDIRVEAPQDMDLQQTLIKIGQNDNVDPETAAQLIQKGNARIIYREYAGSVTDKPKDYMEADVTEGALTGSAYTHDAYGSGEKTEFRFQLRDLRKLDIAKIKGWSENPMALLADLNGVVSEFNRTVDSAEILARKLDKDGTQEYYAGLIVNTGRIEAMFDGKLEEKSPKAKISLIIDNLSDINWQTAVMASMNPDKSAVAKAILDELAKLKTLSLQTEITRKNVPVHAVATVVAGRFDLVANVSYPSGKPRGTLIVRIDDIKNIDVKQINPADMPGTASALGITGQYTEYGEDSATTYQKAYTPENVAEIAEKLTALIPVIE